jgi:Type I phosphodiesterase / nucleotide pyrophosphatase
VKPLVWKDRVSHQEVVPTLAALLGIAPPATAIGRTLREALAPATTRPKVVALFVLDGTRADYLDTYRDVLPTLSRVRAAGAWYSEAHVSSVPTLTAVGHANLGTGAEPSSHGLAVNYLYNRVTGKSQEAYDALDPSELMALTLADVWNIHTEGQAVIVGQGGAIRATAGLVGHGACLVNGRPVRAASYSTAGDGTWETNPKCYVLSDALKPFTAKRYWTEAGGTWMGHDVTSPAKFRPSALFQRFEGDALAAVLEAEPLGADDIPDLVLVNLKGPDYTGHAYGPASPEIKETLAELDRQLARALQIIERKAGAGHFAVAIAADHGMPGEPRPGGRRYVDDIAKRIDARFSPSGGTVVQYFTDAANNEIHLDTAKLASLHVSLRDVAAFLEAEGLFAAVSTEDEVRAAQRGGR